MPLHIAQRRLQGKSTSYYARPKETEILNNLGTLLASLDGSPCEAKFIPLLCENSTHDRNDPNNQNLNGATTKISFQKRGLRVMAFETIHRVQSQGYAIWHTESKLKQEFKGKPGHEIRELIRVSFFFPYLFLFFKPLIQKKKKLLVWSCS